MTNPLDTLLMPFRDLDIARTYLSHQLALDFFIYLTLFLGISQFVFSKRFPDRGGKAISIGIALALATGMTVFSATSGFTLARFGPVAAAVLLILVGLLFYSLIKHLGGNSVNAGLAGFILTYFLMRAVSPELYEWASGNTYASWIDAALLLSIPVLLILLVIRARQSLLPEFALPSLKSKGEKGSATSDAQQQPSQSPKEEEATAAATVQEQEKAGRLDKAVAKDLDAIIAILTKKELTPATINQIKDILQDLQRQETRLERTLNQIRVLNDKLAKWEITSFASLNKAYQQLSPAEQAAYRQTINEERQAILKHKTIQELQNRAGQARQRYQQLLARAINELGHGNRRGAISFLQQARQIESQGKADRAKAEELLRQLVKLTGKALKRARRLAA